MAQNLNKEAIFAEKERIGKLSQIREIVLGAQDGLLVPLGVVSSVAGAFNNNHIVIVAGISEALAGAFSMATGAYLSSQAERQVHDFEISKEKKEIENKPSYENEELKKIFEREGLSTESAHIVTQKISSSPKSFLYTMIQKELGIDPEPTGTPKKDALFVGASYLGSAMVPLFPYFFISGRLAIIASILFTFAALFIIGVVKGRVAALPYIKSGLQVLLIGAASGIGGYFLGTILPHLLGIE